MSGGKESNAEITRRQLIKRMRFVTFGGGALSALSVVHGYDDIKSIIQINREAEREVLRKGIAQPDKSTLSHAQQTRKIIENNRLEIMNPEELRQAREVEIQQETYDRSFGQSLSKLCKESGIPIPLTLAISCDIIFSMIGSAAMAGGAVKLREARHSRAEERGQNEKR